MRRAIFVVVPLLVVIALVTGVILIEARRPAGWQVELDEYLEGRNVSLPGGLRVRSVARASKPWNFSPDMSQAVFGDRMWGGLDLPFPPDEVWCVLLKRDPVSPQGPDGEVPFQVVFVSFHSDRLWRQGWVVHEGAENPFNPAFVESLSEIGCDLGLEEMRPGDLLRMVLRQFLPSRLRPNLGEG